MDDGCAQVFEEGLGGSEGRLWPSDHDRESSFAGPTSPPETGASSHGTLGGGLLGQTFGHSRGGGGEIDQNLRMVRGLQGAMLTQVDLFTSEGNETMEQQIVLPSAASAGVSAHAAPASSKLWALDLVRV